MPGVGFNCVASAGYLASAIAQGSAIGAMGILDVAIFKAVSEYERNSRKSISNWQDQLANRNLKLAQDVHEHFKKFWTYEKDIVVDAFSEPEHVAPYLQTEADFKDLADMTFYSLRFDKDRMMRQLCLSENDCDKARWNRKKGKFVSDVRNFGLRKAEVIAESLNDVRFSRQYSALGLGRNILGSITDYNKAASVVGANAGSILMNSINSGLEALGYAQGGVENLAMSWGKTARSNLARSPYDAKSGTSSAGASKPYPAMLPNSPLLKHRTGGR